MSTSTAASTGRRSLPVGEVVFAVAALGLGVATAVGALGIAVPGSAGVMGPRAFPVVVGALLVAASVAVLVGLARGRRGEPEGGEDVDPDAATDWRTAALVVLAVLAHLVLIEPLGWPIAAAVLFGGAAWALGARPWWRGPLLGLVLGLVIQVVFGVGLKLSLPAGPLLEPVPLLNGRGLGE